MLELDYDQLVPACGFLKLWLLSRTTEKRSTIYIYIYIYINSIFTILWLYRQCFGWDLNILEHGFILPLPISCCPFPAWLKWRSLLKHCLYNWKDTVLWKDYLEIMYPVTGYIIFKCPGNIWNFVLLLF